MSERDDAVTAIRERWAGIVDVTEGSRRDHEPPGYGWGTWWDDEGDSVEARWWDDDGRARALGAVDDVRTLLAALDEARAERDAAHLALRNVVAFAGRLRRTDPEGAAHLLRFCGDAGVVPQILRVDLGPAREGDR